jgi:hypothetical protein
MNRHQKRSQKHRQGEHAMTKADLRAVSEGDGSEGVDESGARGGTTAPGDGGGGGEPPPAAVLPPPLTPLEASLLAQFTASKLIPAELLVRDKIGETVRQMIEAYTMTRAAHAQALDDVSKLKAAIAVLSRA